MQSESQRSFCAVVLYLILFFASIIFVLSSLPATSHPEWCGSWFASAWFVDSAVRWRHNGAGGLKEFVLCGCLIAVFFAVLQFVGLRCLQSFFSEIVFCNLQCCASRSLPARWIVTSAFAGLAAPQAAFALFRKSARCLSSRALLRSALCCSRAEASGASVCEPPRGGASARTAKAGLYFYKPQPPEHLFPLPFRVAASCLFQSAAEPRTIQNSQFKIHNSEFTIKK